MPVEASSSVSAEPISSRSSRCVPLLTSTLAAPLTGVPTAGSSQDDRRILMASDQRSKGLCRCPDYIQPNVRSWVWWETLRCTSTRPRSWKVRRREFTEAWRLKTLSTKASSLGHGYAKTTSQSSGVSSISSQARALKSSRVWELAPATSSSSPGSRKVLRRQPHHPSLYIESGCRWGHIFGDRKAMLRGFGRPWGRSP